MFYLMAAFSVGPILLYCSGQLLPAFVYILCSFCCLTLFRTRYFFPCLFLILGFFYAQNVVQSQQDAQLNPHLIQKELLVSAYLCSIPVRSLRYSSADFCLLDAEDKSLIGRAISLSWSESMVLDLSSAIYKLSVKLKPARATLNFVGSSYEQYMFYRRIVARGVIVDVKSQMDHWPNVGNVAWLDQKINSYRIALDSHLDGFLGNLSHGGLSRALILGERSRITSDEALALSYTGTQHLLAISGLHVGLVMFILYRVLSNVRFKEFLVSALGLFYVLMVGASESATRAWVMVVLAIFFLSGRWQKNYLNVYIAALFIVLVVDPLAPMNIGFWYSFLCVALLILVSKVHPYLKANSNSLVFIQLVLIVGMAPINALSGNVQGISSLVGNAFAVPWVSLLILPINLLGLLGSLISSDIGEILFKFADVGLQVLLQYLSSISDLFYEFSLSSSEWILMLFVLVTVSALFFVRFITLSILLCIVLLTALIKPLASSADDFEFLVFDAGQGLSVAMAWEDQYWLYDTGLSFDRYSLVESAVFPYFREREYLKSLSGLIVSHGDADHAGGTARVDEYLKPKELWMGELDRVAGIRGKKRCVEGMYWEFQKGRVEVLYPFKDLSFEDLSANNHSCVIRFTYKGIVFLLMGDLEGDLEMALVERYRDALKADVLVAGHHGAAGSSSIALLKHVKPKYLVVSSGFLNRFGHPHQSVIERAELMGAKVLSTANTGAQRFLVREQGLALEFARKERSDFWYSVGEYRESP